MSMTKGTPASSQIIWLEGRVQELEQELTEVKRESLKLSALVVERDYQITLANKGYDYEGAVEDARHYKEMAEKYKAELADYKLWAEVEMADLREDLSDHIRMAKDAQEDAGRYRWLRDMNNDEAAVKLFSAWCGQNLDENIDAAIKGSAT